MNTKTISAQKVSKDARKIIDMISEKGLKFDSVLCVGRGGMILGQLLAKRLQIFNVQTLGLKGPNFGVEDGYEIHSGVVMGPDIKYLIVDDYCNTGKTLNFIDAQLHEDADYAYVIQYMKEGIELDTIKDVFSVNEYKDGTDLEFYYE